MNTARFLFCLNSDDPEIVSQGLEEFRDQVLIDHGATVSYGYHGRGSTDNVMETFLPKPVTATVGMLASFIKSSPQLEELFVLWGLPGVDDDKSLSSSLMSCMAVILHAATSNSHFCTVVVNRIIFQHSKSILSRISSGNLKLVHSTLALVLAMCRTSAQNCRDTFQKLVAISSSTFSTVLQQGKVIAFEGEQKDESIKIPKLKTDCRLLTVVIILSAVMAIDLTSGPDIHSNIAYLLKRITSSIAKDGPFLVQLILESLMYIRRIPLSELLVGSKLVDIKFQDNLLYLYHNEDAKIQRVAHSFLLDHSYHLVDGMSKGGRGIVAGTAKASALQLLRHLEGHRDLRHREVQMVLLKAQPTLIAKSIGSVVLTSWEPQPKVQYYCAISQLTFLCASVEVDGSFRSAMKAIVVAAGSDGGSEKERVKAEGSVRGLMSTFVQAMIPPGFLKKDISKLLQHKDHLLQRSGLLYTLSIMQRLVKATTAAATVGIGRAVKIEASVASLAHKLLPDFHLLLSIRSKYSKALLDSNPGHMESGTGVKAMEVEGEIEGTGDHNVDREKVLYLLSLLLRIIECYIKTVPSLATGFELTRLLDEVVPWVSKDSALSASSVISDRINTITVLLGPVVRTLRQATSARQCKWFGSHDDCVKLVTQLMVAQDWHTVVKRSPLAKLLLLASCERLESADPDLCASVRQLVKLILIQSGMFQGHGEVDMELRTEQAAWLSKLSVCDNSILVLESTLRIAYHWNTELCVESSEKIEKHTKSKGYELQYIEGVLAGKGRSVLTAPNSPVMSCAINLCSNSFQTLAAHLPKHIRGHVESAPAAAAAGSSSSSSSVGSPGLSEATPDTTAFLTRYSSGFRMELQGLLLQVVMYTGSRARNPRSYGECVLALSNVDSVFSDDVTLVADLTNIDKLLSLSAAAVAQAQPNKRLSKVTKKKEELPSEALNRCSEQLKSVCSSGSADIVQTFNNVIEKNAEELSSDDPLERTQLHSSIIALAVLNIGKVINSFNTLIEADDVKENSFVHCIDDIGFFTAFICCSTGVGLENETDDAGLGALFYLWISTLSKREMNKSRKTSMELENKAATIVQCVKLVKALCKKHDSLLLPPSASSEPVRSPSIGSKRKSISVAVEGQRQGRDLGPTVLHAASDLTSLIIELVRQTSCAPLIADALNSADLLEGMLHSDTFGKLTRHMLCASASAYFKRSIHKVKKGSDIHGIAATEHATLPLWLNVAERLLVSTVPASRTNSNASALPAAAFQGAEKEIFSLGWMVQHFVADPRLRSQFVDLALKDGQGHLLLDLSLQSAISAHSTFALIPLGAVCVSVLQSASIATLAGALDSFTQSKISSAKYPDSGIDILEGSDGVQDAAVEGKASTATRNALRCATVSIEQNSHSLPYIKSYVSPLSLMQAVGDSSESHGSSSSAPLRPSPLITSSHSKHSDFSFFSHSLPSSFGRGEMTLWDTVKMLREGDLQSDLSLSHVISNADRLKYLLKIEDYYSAGDIAGVGVISVICELLSHPSIVGCNYTVSLLGAYAQSEMSAEEQKSFLKGPVSAIAVCCSLGDIIKTSDEKAISLWCLAYVSFLISLLDDFTAYLSGLGATSHTAQQQSAQLASYFSLLQSMLMIRIKSTAPHHLAITTILKNLTIRAPEISKKLNKWIKSCLKFGLHLAAATDGLTSFYSACRNSTLSSTDVTGSTPVLVGDFFFWGSVFSPKAAIDFYHPSLVLQMIVSHSKFAATLKGSKFMPSNLSLLRLLLVLLSTALPKREVSTSAMTSPLAPLGGRNSVGSGADQFLVGALLQIYQGTICYSDRLIFRILHLLNSADKCPALCTLKPITLNSKKPIRGPEGEGPLVGTILQQLVYSTISQYPAWRACAPPPSDLEGSSAEMTYREEYSILKRGVQNDWAGVEPMQADKPNITGTGSRKNRSMAGKKVSIAADSEGEEEEEEGSDIDEDGEDDSDVDSILSAPMMKDSAADWTCEDSDTYLPSVDAFSGCTDKVYDPSFWLPALHYTLSQKSHSVRQLANTGALSLVIAGVSSRCPVLRAIAVSALQRIIELARQQTPDKDAGFRERPQLLLLLNFIRNSIDSSAPSSSGPKQFPSVISLFLSRAALHLLQPTHELFSKINKYLLSRPFVDYKDVPLYDLLIVDGDATTDQAPRLSTFRIVRDGLMTRGDHLNLCRKNIYNRLMLLFPVLTKDVRAGHAVIDLLDKALGIQVCARYLLERCTIISWLQQMASTTNSLDIDTMSAAETVTQCVVEEIQPIDDDDNEFKERDKGTRSTVVRAQPSIQLAAPPRLLTRVLCLLRRALGAGYLLAAGPSGTSEHTDQIVLAIITLIDDVIAVDRVGMATEIPAEYFRQLVLLMWDYALCSTGRTEGLRWGIDRVYLLTLAIHRSSRAAAENPVDDLVVSLLSLLAFQTSCPVYGPGIKTSRYNDVVDLILGNSLRHLILPEGTKKGEYAIAQSAIPLATADTDTVDETRYHDIQNILSQDNSRSKVQKEKEGTWCLHMGVDPSGSWKRYEEADRSDLSILLHESWEQLALVGYESMALPVSMGEKLILCMTARALLSLAAVRSRCVDVALNSPSDDTIGDLQEKPLFSLDTARWALTMNTAFLRPAANALKLSSSMCTSESSAVFKRALCSVDGGAFNTYTMPFCDFQLTFRLTLLAVASVSDYLTGATAHWEEGRDIEEALRGVLRCILRTFSISGTNHSDMKNTKQIFGVLSNILSRNSDTFSRMDGLYFWEHSVSVRALTEKLCRLALELCSALVSSIDRNVGLDPSDAMQRDSMHSGNEKSKVCGRSMVRDAKALSALCDKLSAAVSDVNLFESSFSALSSDSDSAVQMTHEMCFENIPGRETLPRDAKRPTLLFDRSSSVWRQGDAGSRDRVLASMQGALSMPLSGTSAKSVIHLDESDMDGDDTGEENDDGSEGDSDMELGAHEFDEADDDEDETGELEGEDVHDRGDMDRMDIVGREGLALLSTPKKSRVTRTEIEIDL